MGTEWEFRPERRANWEDIAQAIHDLVKMDDVVGAYAPDPPPRHRRIPCPFHNGKDFNLSFTDFGYRCFVCGASGDVIGFVKDICECATRSDAMKKINADFNLHLPIDGNISIEQSKEISRRRAEAERKKREREAWEEKYNAALDEWVRLDKIIIETPWSSEENIEKVCKAKAERDRVGYALDEIIAEEPR